MRHSRLRRHERVRNKVHGTPARPRLCVFRSLNHIYAQIIDDSSGTTLAQASSLKLDLQPVQEAVEKVAENASDKPEKGEKGEKGKDGKGGKGGKKPARPLSLKMRRSIAVGKAIAAVALAKGIKAVAFDRGGYLYHGRVAALAKAAREGGLEF
ncbi:MAG: 50S ribosomal protein L18 [Candidatus Krumholzibacteria bacterium]|nr:50S ribosomal protein L18 [Candidatus Krumholzibacteria bacterium]